MMRLCVSFGFATTLCLALFAAPTVSAQQTRPTILVSDIDDTLKIVNVPTKIEAAYLAFQTKADFYGMSDLYQALKESQEIDFIYLSNAPESLMDKTHREFLHASGFPAGSYLPKPGFFTKNHKLNSLRKIIETQKPSRLILIGDNGEQDPEVYHQIQTEYANSDLQIYQFIRIAFPSQLSSTPKVPLTNENLFESQIGFVTPIDIMFPLIQAHILPEVAGQALYSKFEFTLLKQEQSQHLDTDLELIEQDQPIAYPYFIECKDYVWKWDEILFPMSLEPLKKKMISLCGGKTQLVFFTNLTQ